MSPNDSELLPETRRALRHRLAPSVVRDERPVWMDGYGSRTIRR